MMKGNNYTIDSENIFMHELIGLNVIVKESTDKSRVGIKGIVVDETMKTLKLKTSDGEKIVPKFECTFEFDINEKVIVDGKLIMKRPEDRVKEWRN